MQFRQALEYAQTQLEQHPERYSFMNGSIPEGKTSRACIFGLAAEGAGLGGVEADIYTMAEKMETTNLFLDFEDAFYQALDIEQSKLLDSGAGWRSDPAIAHACLSAILASTDESIKEDLAQEMPMPDDIAEDGDDDLDEEEWDDDSDDDDTDEDDKEDDDIE